MIKGPQLKAMEPNVVSRKCWTGRIILSAKAKKVGDQIMPPMKTNERHTADIAAISPRPEPFVASGIGTKRSRIGVGLRLVCRIGVALTQRSLAWKLRNLSRVNWLLNSVLSIDDKSCELMGTMGCDTI